MGLYVRVVSVPLLIRALVWALAITVSLNVLRI